MTQVYSVCAADGYEIVNLADPNEGPRIVQALNGIPTAKEWRPPIVDVISFDENGQRLRPFDVSFSRTFGLILSYASLKRFEHVLRDSGELLELSCSDRKLYCFNCTRVLDAIDRERALLRELPNGKVLYVQKHAFKITHLQNVTVFRVKPLEIRELFFTELGVDMLGTNSYSGILFKEVWSGLAKN